MFVEYPLYRKEYGMFATLFGNILALRKKGQGLVEYAIVVAVVIAAAVLVWGILNGSFQTLYNTLSGLIAGALSNG
jgi:predicted Co/Zn/Cd cation transporter (cation efflux family)